MTGYRPNPSEVAVSDDPLKGYTVQGDPCVNDKSNTTFHSQISSVFQVPGRDFYIAVADRWMPALNDWTYTGDVRPDPATQAKIMAKLRELGLDPVKDREEAMKVAVHLSEACNTSLADYVWLPITFEGDTVKLVWRDSWTL